MGSYASPSSCVLISYFIKIYIAYYLYARAFSIKQRAVASTCPSSRDDRSLELAKYEAKALVKCVIVIVIIVANNSLRNSGNIVFRVGIIFNIQCVWLQKYYKTTVFL